MRIAIVGCGLNSDYHIRFAKDYQGIEILAVVDSDASKASACAQRHGIAKHFTSIKEMAASCKPEVVHIITPPRTHFKLASEAIEAGFNIIVEKPLTLDHQEALKLYELAGKKGVKICSMHNHFFDPCMLKARELIESGAAGKVINVESYYGLNTKIDAFRRYPRPNVLPWLYDMPGGVYHDFMPHPLYVMTPYLGKLEKIDVIEKSFGELPQSITDEIRILVKGEKALGVLTFSFASKPFQHFIKYYCTKMVITVNIDTMTTTWHAVSSLPKAAQKATHNLIEAKQLAISTFSNVLNFMTGKLRPYQGMRTLIHRFYDSVQGKCAPPVTDEEALSVVEAMDRIWPQITNRQLKFDRIPASGKNAQEGKKTRVLVTGATGFLGRSLTEDLISRGYYVRALARKLSNTTPIAKLGAEVVFGDVGSIDSLREAADGMDVIVHAAADTEGRKEESDNATILGTRNVINVCREKNLKRLVYISSCSVYGVADYRKYDVVTEDFSLERAPELRGQYSHSKLEAEQMVTSEMAKGLKAVCLRPGTYCGPGGDLFTPMMGLGFGSKFFLVIGRGKFILPLVSIKNLSDAIITTIEKDAAVGRTYNVVDSTHVNKREYVERLMKKLHPKATFFYCPYPAFYFLIWMQERLTGLLGRRPFLTCYRLVSSQKPITYSIDRLRKELGWTPPIPTQKTLEAILDYEQKR